MFRLALTAILVFMLVVVAGNSLLSAKGAASAVATEEFVAQYTDWVFDGYSELLEIPEPSGMCYHPGRDTLFLVDDGALYEDGTSRNSAVYEVDLQAKVLAKLELGTDLEGVCLCSRDGMLYICDEADERIYVVNPVGLTQLSSFQVARSFGGKELLIAGGNGFEGIEYIPGHAETPGYFMLLNQDDPPALIRLNYADIVAARDSDEIPIDSFMLLPKINLGELHFDNTSRELWVVHSWMNVIEILDIDSLEVKRWEICPGAAQEAVAIDGQGRLWIGYDLGGLSRYIKSSSTDLADIVN